MTNPAESILGLRKRVMRKLKEGKRKDDVRREVRRLINLIYTIIL